MTNIPTPLKNYLLSEQEKRTSPILYWLIGSVILTFLPTVLSAAIVVVQKKTLDWMALLGNGELVISSFTIAALTAIDYHKAGLDQDDFKTYFKCFTAVALIELLLYFLLNMDPDKNFLSATIISVLSVFPTITISFASEEYLQRKGAL